MIPSSSAMRAKAALTAFAQVASSPPYTVILNLVPMCPSANENRSSGSAAQAGNGQSAGRKANNTVVQQRRTAARAVRSHAEPGNETRQSILMTGSLSHMRRVLQVAVIFSVVVMAAIVIFAGGTGSTGQAADSKAADVHKSYTETIPGSKVSFDMIAIPGGTYMMGSPASEPGRASDEGPQHAITIRPFWMAKCELAWEE